MLKFESHFSSSSGNLYTCSDGDTHIIIDFGVPYKKAQKALDFNLKSYSGAIVGHRHMDHCAGVMDAVKHGMDCFMLEDTKSHLGISSHRAHVIKPLVGFEIESLKILPFQLEHDVPTVGFLIESASGGKIVYINDSYYCRYRFKGLNIIAINCNYHLPILQANLAAGIVPMALKNRILKSHFSLDNVKEFLKANDLSQVREIYLIHLSETNSDADLFKSEVERLTGKPTYIS